MTIMRIAVPSALLLLAGVPASAQQRPKVQVVFKIAPSHPYGDMTYAPANLAFIEGKATDALLAGLERIRFVEFVRTPAPWQLAVTLENEDPIGRPSGTHRVGFRSRVLENALPVGDALFWTFREPERYTLVTGPKETFANELTVSLQTLLAANGNALVGTVLRKIPVATQAHHRRDVFVLPFSAEDFEMGNATRFAIDADVTDTTGVLTTSYLARVRGHTPHGDHTYPDGYRNKLMAQPQEPAQDLPLLLGSGTVLARAVYVVSYERASGVRRTLPGEFVAGPGQ